MIITLKSLEELVRGAVEREIKPDKFGYYWVVVTSQLADDLFREIKLRHFGTLQLPSDWRFNPRTRTARNLGKDHGYCVEAFRYGRARVMVRIGDLDGPKNAIVPDGDSTRTDHSPEGAGGIPGDAPDNTAKEDQDLSERST